MYVVKIINSFRINLYSMKDEDIDRPSAMKVRQGIQDAMTYSLPDKHFSEKKIELVEIDIELENLGGRNNLSKDVECFSLLKIS